MAKAKGRDSALKRPAASNRKSKAKVDKSPAEAKVDKSPAEEPDSKILKRPAGAKPPKKDPKEKDDHESGKKKKVDPKVAARQPRDGYRGCSKCRRYGCSACKIPEEEKQTENLSEAAEEVDA